MKLIKFIKDTKGIYNAFFQKGSAIKYLPWKFEWQGMTEPERVEKGIFVHCHGHGEFDVFTKEDVILI